MMNNILKYQSNGIVWQPALVLESPHGSSLRYPARKRRPPRTQVLFREGLKAGNCLIRSTSKQAPSLLDLGNTESFVDAVPLYVATFN